VPGLPGRIRDNLAVHCIGRPTMGRNIFYIIGVVVVIVVIRLISG